MSIRYDLLSKLSKYLLSNLVYYPDIIPFQHNEKQYFLHWQSLTTSKYIYTNGYVIEPTNWFMYAFQSFKGWLGFDNHCQAEKIQFSLEKLAYYGYLRGYDQSVVRQIQHYPLPADYLALINRKSPVNSQTTNALQHRLILDYNNLVAPYTSEYLYASYVFGQTLKRLGLPEEIPLLDPQNEQLIEGTIATLEPLQSLNLYGLQKHLAEPKYTFPQPSLYAKKMAEHYVKAAKAEKGRFFYGVNFISSAKPKAQLLLDRACQIDPVAYDNEILYIEHHLEHKEFDIAFNLINKLKDLDKALAYLFKNFTPAQRMDYVKQNTPLALKLAQHILKEKDTLQNIELAAHYDSNIAEHHPDKAFILLVQTEKYDEAYTLFEKHREIVQFPASQLETLAQHFDDVGERLYEQGAAERENKLWDNAEKNYLNSLYAKKKAATLLPDTYTEVFYTHKRLYAQLLINSDSANSKGLEVINKAIRLLDKCFPKSEEEKVRHQKALAKGLMSQVTYLTAKIKVEATYSRDFAEQKRHHEKHQANFAQIRTSLLRVIELLTPMDDAEQKRVLAKAHFILADMILFFDLDEEYRSHFENAARLAPENPIYILKASELLYRIEGREKEYELCRDDGIIKLKAKNYVVMDFYHWDTERWYNNNLAARYIPDIHILSENMVASEDEESYEPLWFRM
ncbi:hypothetical protein [Legionella saoudiensis]|uniref:hypothetical protein n=1 Tax=Legionella saoudiensis TaxID=1750561 RepID=UPI00072FFC1E|nr:hypothetical protein [Legionella saoudiensis]